MGHVIKSIMPGSIAEELCLKPQDMLLKINSREIQDVLDYKFLCSNTEITAEFLTGDNECFEAEIIKDADEDLGLEFTKGLMDDKKRCRNRCVFCFIDQLPKYALKSLRFKDDDWRMSFLSGNYVTLTNVTDEELDRIIEQRISPLYISVHVTDGSVRRKMLANKSADRIMEQLERLKDGKIAFHTQVVLCKGLNDNDILEKTLEDLFALHPWAKSCAVVPVGLTGHRERLYPLSPFTSNEAAECVELVEKKAKKFKEISGSNFCFCADEFYVLSKKRLPDYEYYGNFEQLEDGVGMLAKFENEFYSALKKCDKKYKCTVATGKAAHEFFLRICKRAADTMGIEINVIPVENEYFGGYVAVAGLLTGSDFKNGLTGKDLGDIVFIPGSTLRYGNKFLDDKNPEWLQQELNTPVKAVGDTGKEFYEALQKGLED